MIKVDPEWAIRKLKVHAKCLLTVWIILLPVFFILFDRIGAAYFAAHAGRTALFYYLYGALILLTLFFVYLTFYYVVDRSVSTRLMIEIDDSPAKKLSFREILVAYDVNTKYENEVKGMVEGGFVKKDGEYYSNTQKGRMVAVITRAYKRIFRLGKGG